MKIVGIDGCKHGRWVVASSDEDLLSIRFDVEEDLRALFKACAREDAIVAIDIPIGRCNTARLCDQEARRVVGRKRASSVFPPPCREALRAATHREASEINRRVCGKRLPIQTFGILARIRQVDRWISPRLQGGVREAHPEVTFAVLKGGPLGHPKKTREGEAERLTLLGRAGVRFDIDAERLQLGRGTVKPG